MQYQDLSGSGQQAVDMWRDDRISWNDVPADARQYLAANDCGVCRAPLSEHIGTTPCVQSAPSTAKNLYDLPIFGRFWDADGRDLNA